jgi:hypothetical protein
VTIALGEVSSSHGQLSGEHTMAKKAAKKKAAKKKTAKKKK